MHTPVVRMGDYGRDEHDNSAAHHSGREGSASLTAVMGELRGGRRGLPSGREFPYAGAARAPPLRRAAPRGAPRMRVGLAVAMVVLALLSGSAAAQSTVQRVTIKGAHGVIIMPKDWNGGLFLYAHGYTADKRILVPIPDDLTTANLLLIPGLLFVPPGYASAVTTFRSVGWYVKDAVKDIENLRRYFVKRHGKPTRTYVWGHSGGGMVTQAVIEYFPRTYVGAAPMCGPGAGGWRNFNGAFDVRVLYEYACRRVPEARFACRVLSHRGGRCLKEGDCPVGQTCGGPEGR